MPPRKNLKSSSSSKKSNPNQLSQRSKFGIQHFFERHSQHSAHPHKCNSRVASSSAVPVPENGAVPVPCSSVPSSGDLGNSKIEGPFGREVIDLTLPESDLKVSGANDVVLASKKASDYSYSLESIAKNPSLDKSSEELMIIGVNAAGENISEASPEVCKSDPIKRFKFSPGMLIKESQDDGSDEIIWKISPVNERLHAVSKQMPETIRVLAESSRLNCMKIRQCSQNKAPPCKTEKIEKSTSSPVLKSSESSLVSMGVIRPKRFKSDKGIDCNKIIYNNGSNSEVDSSQSPFRTPPSLSYYQDKVAEDVTCCVAANQLNLRQHKRALLELLDQVEDVISVDNSLLIDLEDYPPKVKGRNFEKQLVTTDPALNIMAVDVPKKITGGFNFDFLVLEVSEKCGSADSSAVQTPYKVLRLLNEKNGQERAAYLWQEWSYSAISPGDTVNVIGEFDDQGRCNIDHNNNFIILHPDILVSGSRVASSFSCPRRTVLDERLKCNEHSTSALLGTLLHQIFQAGLTNDLPNKAFLEEYARIVVQQNMENVYACGANENDINKAIIEAIPKILRWITLFKHSKVHEAPTVEFRSDEGRRKRISISEVIDIEEMAWAPRYGLKGMIDASLRVNVALDENQVAESIMPLEFKTGKMSTGQSSMEHIAQVILYTLLMSERYQKPIGSGLLYYLQSDQTQGILVQRPDIVGLIMRRNEFANDIHNASKKQSLPPMLQSLSMCRGCRHLDVCTIYHKAHGGNTEGSGLGNLFDSRTQHLTGAHGIFLRHWERLIDLEAKESELVKKQRWNSRNSNNDQLPSSLSSMILDASEEHPLGNIQKDNRYVYRFVSPELSSSRLEEFGEDYFNSSSSSNELEGSLKKGDHVILSTESSNLNVARGIITDINRFHVIVSFSKRLRLPGSRNSSEANDLLQQVWRIHKDIFMSIFAIMRFNLVQLFLQDVHSAHLRKLIVDLEPPRFDIGCTFSQDPAVSYVWSEKNLNDDQRRAILKILTAKDYALILGMPGTGKTSTLVHAVKALLIRGASILLTSYTNSAIDNLLIKLRAQNIDFVRIGRYNAVHEEIRGHCFSEVHSVDDIKIRMDQVKVVAVTCLGITSPLLANKRFDICIMDEAGQTTLPVSLGPLMFASAFVLVGDHYQLPPLIQSTEARENGMGISLFCRLSEAHTQAISALQSQYRMCQGIMELSNALIYGDRLRCGSEDIANAKLEHSNLNSHPSWLKEVLNPSKQVIFINTDLLPAYEAKDHKALNNHIEAQILAEVTQRLVSTGINGNAIGIITPYNAQANLIRLVVNLTSVEIHTIDKYQGRDKDCVLVSFVRSTENPKNCTSSLLGDWHRINVAITRAKKKLIMVGSSKTLSRIPLLKLLIEKVDEQSGILTVSNEDILLGRGLRGCSNVRLLSF